MGTSEEYEGVVAYVVCIRELWEGVDGRRTVCERAKEWDSECGLQHHLQSALGDEKQKLGLYVRLQPD